MIQNVLKGHRKMFLKLVYIVSIVWKKNIEFARGLILSTVNNYYKVISWEMDWIVTSSFLELFFPCIFIRYW